MVLDLSSGNGLTARSQGASQDTRSTTNSPSPVFLNEPCAPNGTFARPTARNKATARAAGAPDAHGTALRSTRRAPKSGLGTFRQQRKLRQSGRSFTKGAQQSSQGSTTEERRSITVGLSSAYILCEASLALGARRKLRQVTHQSRGCVAVEGEGHGMGVRPSWCCAMFPRPRRGRSAEMLSIHWWAWHPHSVVVVQWMADPGTVRGCDCV